MKHLLIKLVKYLMIPFGFLYSLVKPCGILILMYHRVNDDIKKELSVTVSDFRWQMEYLNKHGYRVITLDEALGRYAASRKKKYVVLTFDDGYEDFYKNAYPVLLEYGYPAVLYVVPGYIETCGVFSWDQDIGESRLMDWNQIATIKDSALIQIGSHTLTHADLDALNEEETRRELGQSRELLEEKLGQKVSHFAYPRGIMTLCAVETARGLYKTAVSIFEGDSIGSPKGFDPMKVRRAPVQRSDGRYLFPARLKGWLAPEGWLKRAVGRH